MWQTTEPLAHVLLPPLRRLLICVRAHYHMVHTHAGFGRPSPWPGEDAVAPMAVCLYSKLTTFPTRSVVDDLFSTLRVQQKFVAV